MSPNFVLGTHPFETFTECWETCWIEHETKKAYLFRRIRVFPNNKIDESWWIPKSQATFRERPIIRIIDGKPREVRKDQELHINDWFWDEKKTPAQPMGVRNDR